MKHKFSVLVVISIFLCIGISSIYQIQPNSYNNFSNTDERDEIQTQTFSEDDYNPIVEDDREPLGNVTVDHLTFDQPGFYNYTIFYPNLDDDYKSGALNVSYVNIKFITTKDIAQIRYLGDTSKNLRKIIVLLNETVKVQYNTSVGNSEGYLIYRSRLSECKLNQFLLLSNGSESIEEVPKNYYKIDENYFLKFNYATYFTQDYHNFTMYLIWEYNITLRDWGLSQIPDRILIKNQTQVVNPQFNYAFQIEAYKYANRPISLRVNASNLFLDLRINPPDMGKLYDHTMTINNETTNVFLNTDNSINVSLTGAFDFMELNFTADYMVKFIDPVENTWAIDRLVRDRNQRERIYFYSLVDGPKYIILKHLMIFELTIILDQVIKNSSLFERNVQYYDLNISSIEEALQPSLIFTKNAVKKQGLRIILPYAIVGETVPFILTYDANNDLLIKITDSINMPLVDVDIVLYYYQKLFGTYISNDLVLPMAPVSTNENGEAIINNMPNGNYSAMIYKGEKLIKISNVNTYQEFNLIITNEIHFPLVILIFGAISTICLLLGIIIHIYYKKRQ